ncbi:MAG: hypothetical protein HY830_03510 [Actinobacteria bacterium]|nr:hypothetical protein [Actinomycetota bacterium]
MTADYNFTVAGLRRVLSRDLSPAAVWQVLGSDRRVIRRADPYVLVIGISDTGDYLAVLVQPAGEDDGEDLGWDVVDARPLDEQEREAFNKITGRTP